MCECHWQINVMNFMHMLSALGEGLLNADYRES